MVEDKREIKQTCISSTTLLIYRLEFLSIIDHQKRIPFIIKNGIPLEFVTRHMQLMKNAACYKKYMRWKTCKLKAVLGKILTSSGQYFAYILIYFR